MPETLPVEIEEWLRATRTRRGQFGEPVYFFPETASTNDVAASLAERGAPEGTTVLALSQTAGRGRLGRGWFSPPGAGLYVSIVCRNALAAPFLTLAGGVAVADGVRAVTGLPCEIKWPNDVVLTVDTGRVRRRKLAGVLAEASTGGHGLLYVVLGFGINMRCAVYPAEIADRATSIEAELGRAVEPGSVFAETLAAFAGHMAQLSAGRTEDLLTRWRALAPSARGCAVEWDSPSGRVTGTTAGIDATGALVVRAGGRVERIIS
ncbi:MAG: biotin--[acetyl-CoA-carboxylase] ligase, partial [Acidobacteria bacterium]|nr:biotin--[acetyl-CoA-carboxylase] ligase [Acidobacteriota bacterium]